MTRGAPTHFSQGLIPVRKTRRILRGLHPFEGPVRELGLLGDEFQTRSPETHQLVRIAAWFCGSLRDTSGVDQPGELRSLRLTRVGCVAVVPRDGAATAQIPNTHNGEAAGLVRTAFNQSTGPARNPRYFQAPGRKAAEVRVCGNIPECGSFDR